MRNIYRAGALIEIFALKEFIHARLEYRQNELWVYPALLKSSLQSMARKEALIIIPEGREKIDAGETVDIQLFTSSAVSHFATSPIT